MDYLESCAELRRKGAAYNGPVLNPKALPARLILQLSEVFQHRTCNGAASSAHKDVLVKVLLKKPDKPLEPVKVWQCADAMYCIDGHHRLEAYAEVKFKGKIPVEVFKGTLEEALAEAARGNTKDKLPMARHEKYNAAWRLTLATKLSLAKVADSAGCSDRLVTAMRKARGKLLRNPALLHGREIDSLTWGDARRFAEGEKPREASDYDDRVEREAQLWANRMVKTFGKTHRDEPLILARMLEIYDGRLPKVLSEIWQADFSDEFDPVMPTGDF